MPLAAGARLGSYIIEAPLGAGGMGEVYRACDTKLKRDVALKVLPDLVAGDPDRLARFRREALVLASLNHPNIAHVYGFEDAPTPALIMELVEGSTLADRIATGPVPLDEALPIARQIADALEAAHERDIIHRDLKPANVKVRDDGTVKVLDFGLAKALEPAASSGVMALTSPTLTARATELGVILGTAAYMAPEQAKGRPVDRRADIWAFGCVLFEMLSGKRPFGGDDITDTLASVLKEAPDWTALPPTIPPALQRLLRRCLEKDPKKRLSAIGDARLELDDAVAYAPEPARERAAVPAPRSRLPWVVTGGVAAMWLATLVAAWPFGRPPIEAEPVQFLVNLPQPITAERSAWPSISPDGRTLAFASSSTPGEPNSLWIRPIGALEPRRLPGTEGAAQLFWSADSRSVGFVASGKLKRIEIAGGAPLTVCDVPAIVGLTWGMTGEIVFAAGTGQSGTGLFRVPAAGGTPERFAKPDEALGETGFLWPHFLPDGRHVVYLAWNGDPGKRALYIVSRDGGAPARLMNATSQALYAPPGLLLFHRDGTVFSQPFDAGTRRLSGEPTRVVDGVSYSRNLGRADLSASATGVLAYRLGLPGGVLSDLTWLDRTGRALGNVGDARAFEQVRLSPDEKRAVVSEIDPKTAAFMLSVVDLTTQITARLTVEQVTVNDPVWSPDSQTVAFESLITGKRDIFQQGVGSRGQKVLFESSDPVKWLDDWSKDGRYILFHVPTPGKLYALPVGDAPDAGKARLIAELSAAIDEVHFSYDGKWIVYQSAESGNNEVWVAAFPAFDRRRQISARGGGQAWWRGDDKEIFYLTAEGKVMSVAVLRDAKTGTLEFGAPTLLFQSPLSRPNLNTDQYSVTRDGERFLFIHPQRDQDNRPAAITVSVNWKPGPTP